MIAVSQAVVVEGRYDKIKLDSVVDGLVVTTDGFNIFKDTEKQQLLRRLADECGLIVLTDSDDAGFKIRKYISDITAGGAVFHAYIPEQPGKERRKTKLGSAGLIGVEGIDIGVIEDAIRKCVGTDAPQAGINYSRRITAVDFFEDGLGSRAGAKQRRAKLLRLAGLPSRLSTNAALDILTKLYGYNGYKKLVRQINDNGKED